MISDEEERCEELLPVVSGRHAVGSAARDLMRSWHERGVDWQLYTVSPNGSTFGPILGFTLRNARIADEIDSLTVRAIEAKHGVCIKAGVVAEIVVFIP